MTAAPGLGADRCPRCGGTFHCGVADAVPCPCSGLVLSPRLQAALRERWSGCLCLTCLARLAADDAARADALPPLRTPG